MKPRFTDSVRFRLPYVSAQESAKSGYLEARFAQYRELQRAEAAATGGEMVSQTYQPEKVKVADLSDAEPVRERPSQLSAHHHEVLPLKRKR